jgi:hypothetical protein
MDVGLVRGGFISLARGKIRPKSIKSRIYKGCFWFPRPLIVRCGSAGCGRACFGLFLTMR